MSKPRDLGHESSDLMHMLALGGNKHKSDDNDTQDEGESNTTESAFGAGILEDVQGGLDGPVQTARQYFDEKGNVRPGVQLPYERHPGDFVPKDKVENLMSGVGSIESGGNVTGKVDYGAIGPLCASHVTGRFPPGIDGHALGAWQVMAENVGPWAREVGLGNVTPEQFLRDPELQRKIVYHQFEKHLAAGYRPEDAASIWFSGRPLAQAQAMGVSDGGNTAPQYVQKIMGHYRAMEAYTAAHPPAPVASADDHSAPGPRAGTAPDEPHAPPYPKLSVEAAKNLPAPTAGGSSAPEKDKPEPAVSPVAAAAGPKNSNLYAGLATSPRGF